MSGAILPSPEPPADDVAELLDELRRGRAEMADAGRLVSMLARDYPGPESFPRHRHVIEVQVAERRCELWAKRIAVLESRCRARGIDPGGVL